MKGTNTIHLQRGPLGRVLLALLMLTAFLVSCTKEMSDVRLSPSVGTSKFQNVKADSATVVGYIVAQGGGFTEKGICYSSTNATPTTADSKAAYTGSGNSATYTVKIGGLTFATKYYARAYAIGANGTVYGDPVTFTTLPVVPFLTTAAITNVTGKTASGGGNVTGNGGSDVSARGVCFATTHNPTISATKTSDGTGTGAFTSALTGLKGNTIYYVRAYATNSAGTGYGPEVTFTTPVDLPAVTTAVPSNITKTSAIFGGEVTYDGGGTVTARGLVWGLNANPTLSDNKIDGGTGVGVFTGNATTLLKNTTYHVRAYATNSVGTVYGNDVSFTTLADIVKLWVVGAYNGWSNSDAAKYIISTATSNGDAEGYVYFATAGEFKLTSDHSWDDAHTFGLGSGSGKLANPGSGNLSVPTAGYYLIKANTAAMTYSVTKTTWAIIGNATPGGWGTDTPLTFDPATGLWSGYASLTKQTPPDNGLKFRANNDWAINYGDTGADGTLEAGGTNIGVAETADNYIVLDLSHPNAYTYSLTSWGLIGDATGSWDNDQNMTWDSTAKVWKITMTLSAGAIKFRTNNSWTTNLGGNLNALTPGGDNISIATAGNYTITLDPIALKATVTKN